MSLPSVASVGMMRRIRFEFCAGSPTLSGRQRHMMMHILVLSKEVRVLDWVGNFGKLTARVVLEPGGTSSSLSPRLANREVCNMCFAGLAFHAAMSLPP